jgi:biopolymer transport protein ExbB
MRQVATKKLAIAVGVAALVVLGFSFLDSLGLVSPAAAVAQEDGEKNPPEPAAAGAEGAKAPAADGETTSTSKKPQNMLAWFFGALGWRYTISFLIISFTFVAFIVMNLLSARRDSICPKHLSEAFEAQLNEKKFQEAYDLAKNDESMLGQVLAAGMQNLQQGYDKAVEAMGQVGEEENLKLEQRLSMISLVASIAPMVGLLGTVDGMVMAFMEIAGSDTTPKPSKLAEGVSTALITTLVGLVLAIPAIIFFNMMKNRIARLVLEVGQVAGQLMGRFENIAAKK